MSLDARAWLKNGSHARVLYIFDEACNLIDGDSEVLALVLPRIGDGPFSIVLPPVHFPTLISSTSTISRTEDCLRVGRLAIELRSARVWNPRPDWDQLRASKNRLEAALQDVLASMTRMAPSESLAGLVLPMPEMGSDLGARLLRHAREPAGKLVHGLRSRDEDLIREGAAGLAGLGNGLTPAGDDWIMGSLLGAYIHLDEGNASRAAAAAMDVIGNRTTALSTAMLRAAARGECSAPWHELLQAMQRAEPRAIGASVERVVARGHTSGADALAGFAAVLGKEIPSLLR
jgi:hypothetical protein